MNHQPILHALQTAARGAACGGAASAGHGTAPGLVVIESNRPAMTLATARGLLKQFGAAH